MTAVDWKQVRSVFEQAILLAETEREAFVSRACGEDEKLRAGVEELLAADARSEGVLDAPSLSAPELFSEVAGEIVRGRRIGAYTIRRTIAVGGMGTVFEAEQDSPRRVVALKVIRFGLATAEALRRARYEAEVLAQLHHPGIAQVFESGTYRVGSGERLPFFAMEFVERARSLIEYADESKLDLGARIDLFRRVCEAVQHGHAKGVIHRDLKPSNILVDRSGSPKVIDFGLARAADPRLVSESLRTQAGHITGTLQYMAPEQLEANPALVDTRADLYALGVVLHELLCGRPPIEVCDVPLLEAARRLKHDQPARPSSIRGDLHRELDWILGRALEKDPARRYAAVAELSEDLRRFQQDLPILASPPSQTYRISLFVRRHRFAVGAAATLFLTLVLGVIGTGTGVVQAKEAQLQAEAETRRALKAEAEALAAKALAEDEAEKSRQIADFTLGIFEAAEPRYSGGEQITARELLDRGAERVRSELHDQPVLRGAMTWALGDAYRLLGSYDRAVPLLEEALEIRRETHGNEHLDVASSLGSLGAAYYQLDRFGDAERLHREAMGIRRELLGERSVEHATSLSSVAVVLCRTGDLEQAEPLIRRALEIKEAALGERDRALITPLNSLAMLLKDLGEYAEAAELLERAVELCEEAYDRPHPHHAFSLQNLGIVLQLDGDLATARRHLSRALEIARDLYSEDYPLLASILTELASTTMKLGHYREAVSVMTEALEMRRRIFGDVHSEVSHSLHQLGVAHRMLGELDEAEAAYRESLSISRQIEGDESGNIAIGLSNLASVLRAKGKYDEAGELYDKALETQLHIHGEVHLSTASTRLNIGRLLKCRRRYDEALEQLDAALSTAIELSGPVNESVAVILDEIGTVLRMNGEPDLAESSFREAREMHRTVVGDAHPQTIKTVLNLSQLLIARERGDEAEALMVEGLSALETSGAGDENSDVQLVLRKLVEYLESSGQSAKAAPYRERRTDS